MKKVSIFAIAMGLLFVAGMATAANIAIIESQSANPAFDQDEMWQDVAQGLGHTAFIYQQSYLDDPNNSHDIDLLIISSGVIDIPQQRKAYIREFLRMGTPVYLQSEYDASFGSNETWLALVQAMGGIFNWQQSFYGDLTPMQITGDLATAYNNVYTINEYFVNGCAGFGGFSVVTNLEFQNRAYGWYFDPPNTDFAALTTNTDRNWILQGDGTSLMENYIELLLADTVTVPVLNVQPVGSTVIPASGGVLHAEAQVINNSNSFLNVDFWTRVILPSGTPYGPLFRQTDKTFDVGFVSPWYPLTQMIPFSAPAGTYQYQVVMGNFDYLTEYAVDGFEWTKSATGTDAVYQDWAASGFGMMDASTAATVDEHDAVTLPDEFTLSDPYPNPFNPSTTINVSLAEAAPLQVVVYDLQGRVVSTLANGSYTAGSHTFSFDAHNLASGVYFVQAQTNGLVQTRKLVLMK
ncbi:T9SS type A sorting domain-containing protein [bacterium]|nr:T9SS type A sorting domain-containing protein [bacterium]